MGLEDAAAAGRFDQVILAVDAAGAAVGELLVRVGQLPLVLLLLVELDVEDGQVFVVVLVPSSDVVRGAAERPLGRLTGLLHGDVADNVVGCRLARLLGRLELLLAWRTCHPTSSLRYLRVVERVAILDARSVPLVQLVGQGSLARTLLQLRLVVHDHGRSDVRVLLVQLNVLLGAGPLLEHHLAAGSGLFLGAQLAFLSLKCLQVRHNLVDLLLHVEQIVGDLLLLGHSRLPLLFNRARSQRLMVQTVLFLELEAKILIRVRLVQLVACRHILGWT